MIANWLVLLFACISHLKPFHVNRKHFLNPSDMDSSFIMTLSTNHVFLNCTVSYRSFCFPVCFTARVLYVWAINFKNEKLGL